MAAYASALSASLAGMRSPRRAESFSPNAPALFAGERPLFFSSA
jgi:hypothetical protein